jgi:hypothetical protein
MFRRRMSATAFGNFALNSASLHIMQFRLAVPDLGPRISVLRVTLTVNLDRSMSFLDSPHETFIRVLTVNRDPPLRTFGPCSAELVRQQRISFESNDGEGDQILSAVSLHRMRQHRQQSLPGVFAGQYQADKMRKQVIGVSCLTSSCQSKYAAAVWYCLCSESGVKSFPPRASVYARSMILSGLNFPPAGLVG